MTPLSRFGLQRGWDTILEIVFVVATMSICTFYIVRTIASNGQKSQIILMNAVQELGTSKVDQAVNQKNLSDHLDVIGQRDQLIIDRLTFQQTLLDDLRKRGN